MSCRDCGMPCQGPRCQHCARHQRREGRDGRDPRTTEHEWYPCGVCDARYRGRGAALLCCSTSTGGDDQ